MYFVLLAAALAILAGVVVVAMGRGGEMTEFSPDRPATVIRVTTAADVVRLRLPLALLGYQQRAADEALNAAAVALAQRDAEIARLRAGLTGSGLVPAPPVPPASPASPTSPASSKAPPA